MHSPHKHISGASFLQFAGFSPLSSKVPNIGLQSFSKFQKSFFVFMEFKNLIFQGRIITEGPPSATPWSKSYNDAKPKNHCSQTHGPHAEPKKA